jgi:hypothetical protein
MSQPVMVDSSGVVEGAMESFGNLLRVVRDPSL